MNGVMLYGFFVTIICVIVVVLVVSSTINIMTGDEYTEEKWWNAEQNYCAQRSMEAQKYVTTQCSLLGCVDVEKTKCVNDNNEILIDYSNKMFCKYTVKGDLGGC